jgi:hypothetical protein
MKFKLFNKIFDSKGPEVFRICRFCGKRLKENENCYCWCGTMKDKVLDSYLEGKGGT